ncbi:MFS transporter [Bacillus fonticola]|uniref:MFS transporter n=1 Tax=Bacillus fonticola TaxID=2728853 RepID=UPI002AD504BA|nr:MFS transporter [Bacillus fonticola]
MANFLVAGSATMVMPFLSLYIETFGNFSDEYVQRWAGFVFGITFLMAFLVSPIWGRIADRKGYKPILVITGYGIATSIFLMGFMESVAGLFFLRVFMGIVTGFIPTSLAFISKQTPKEVAGRTLGTLQMGTVSGGLLGPLIGGALADSVGFSYTFIITATAIIISTTMVLFLTKEVELEEDEKENQKHYTRKEVLQFILQHRVLFTLMLLSTLVQVANFSVQPLLALYVAELTNATNVALLAGFAFSATGFGNLLATRKWGTLGDRIGYEKVLLILLLAASLLFIPQAFANALWQLVLARFLFGMAIGGIIPCVTAYVRQVAPQRMQGELQGYTVSFRFLGNVIGPVMGGVISGWFGIQSVFFVTSALFFTACCVLFWSVRHEESQETLAHNSRSI